VQPAEAVQQTEPELQPAGGGKKEKERERKERQRQRRMEEAREALQVAMEAMMDARCVSPLWLIGRFPPFPWEVVVSSCGWQGALTWGGVCGCSGESALGAVEEATAEAAKHGDRSSEQLSALVAEARVMIEQAKAVKAERARVAAEQASAAAALRAAAAAAVAAERLRLEEEATALALAIKSDMLRVRSNALRLQQVQAQLGVSPAAPAPHLDAEETMCVVCFGAPKQYAMLPCLHMCACEACAQQLLHVGRCPVCREPIGLGRCSHKQRLAFSCAC
jgi:hypothetical protein